MTYLFRILPESVVLEGSEIVIEIPTQVRILDTATLCVNVEGFSGSL